MTFRWLPLLGFGLLACEGGDAAPLRMDVEIARGEAESAPFAGRVALGWVHGDELLLDASATGTMEQGRVTLELGEEPSVAGGFYPEWSSARGARVRIGVLAAIDAADGDVVKLSPAYPTVSRFRLQGHPERRVETWCDVDPDTCEEPGGCGDVHELCYQEIYECSRADARDCELVSTNGDAVHGNRFGHLRGLAEDYLVIHASEALPAHELARQGLYTGPLEAGYHVVRAEALEGEELDASRACWKQAEAYADEYDAGRLPPLDIEALLASEREHDDLYDASWAGLRVLIGTVGLHCPYRHVRYEVVAPEEAHIAVRMSRLARPLFRFLHPANDLDLKK
jgi:hypothetical protein